MTFQEFFQAATGWEPFAWQRRLAEQVTQGDHERAAWPDVCALPTAAGKTSLLLVGLYALAVHPRAHRRIAYVVDRRIVVDEAYRLAKSVRDALDREPLRPFRDQLRTTLKLEDNEATLEVLLMRGGLGEPMARLSSPVSPTIMVGTVDQLGSRLLMRGYGVTERMRPIAGGLLAHDTLWIVDEAHLSGAFVDSLRNVQRSVAAFTLASDRPLHLIEVSATPRQHAGAVFKLGVPDDAIGQRIRAVKDVHLVEAAAGKTRDEIVELVRKAAQSGKRRIGVIVNRVNLARDIFGSVRKRLGDGNAECLLFIGPVRPHDRDRLYERASARALQAQSKQVYDKPIVAVCTQTVEVGADLDFDALFVQAAPLDVLRQRFGRLDRLGKQSVSAGAIIWAPETGNDRLYGEATNEAIRWLRSVAVESGTIDFGVAGMGALVDALPRDLLDRCCTQRGLGEPLHPEHQLRLAYTSVPNDVAIFLHSEAQQGDVQIVWRDSLLEGDEGNWKANAEGVPPCSRETLTVSIYAAQAFLKCQIADVADIPEADRTLERGNSRRALRWNADGDQTLLIYESELRVGDTIMVPSSYGGADEFGWSPNSPGPVQDISIEAFVIPPKTSDDLDVLRAARLVMPFRNDDQLPVDDRIAETLSAFANDYSQPSLHRGIALAIKNRSVSKRTVVSLPNEKVCVTWRLSLDDDNGDEADASSFTRAILLDTHLRHVADRTEDLATRCGLPREVIASMRRAAQLHDLGKADERFQLVLRGGDLIAAVTEPTLAKGIRRFLGRRVPAAPHDRWHPGMRHEAISVAMLGDDDALVRHLVGTHHGYGRPWFPSVEDRWPRSVSYTVEDKAFEASSYHRLGIGGWDEQFEQLLMSYGVWGLAYLEAILRLADHRCSREEEESVADVA